MYESQEATARTDESTSPLELVSTQQHCTDDSTNENDYQHTDLDLAEKTNVDGVNSNDDVSSDDIYHFNEHRVKSPVYDSLSSDILAKNDLFDLTDNDTDDNLDLSSSNCFVLDSQPESSYVMGDEYGFSDKSHSPSSDQQQLTTTTNDESTKTRSPVLPEHSIGHDDNRSSLDLMIHCSNSPPKIGRLQQRDISDFMSSEPEPVYQESVEKRRKLKSPKRELDRQHQRQLHQTELDVFYSQLSSGSSLSTAKSFFDDDDDTQLSNTKSSQTRQKDANTLSSLEQLRVEKQSKRSTQSPNEKQQWMSTLSMPRTKSSLSPCTQQKDNKSQEVEEEKGMNRMKRNTKMATTSVMTDPSKPRQRSYGLSKPRSISSAKRTTPSISALITGQHGPSLQPCDVIVKTGKIGSRKKTLGMTRRFNIYK
ncbi:uncharacterized protein BX664DRAFT_331076 [Halteromyces radiatus]|uniref:uncharacterized protein n=1 Tax=Halteromyces radiatus TaxID=101107 RepID=UPI002220C312|nr:uncharacterized protein BX664DRAFT_331076 [Halteromyces radiatus]KAI8088673.1 hypothetical protein BX664DRAFT_331076 [Halteromyces radiatus]